MNWKTACKIAAPAAACAGAFAFLVAPGRATRAQKAPFLCRNYAHRGLHTEDGSVPENSLPAFRAAAEAGYAVEMDVHLTADDRLVVFHDDTLERMCGVQGVIDDFTLAELRALRLGKTECVIPTFAEALEALGGRVPLLLEVKRGHDNRRLCALTLEALRTYTGPYCVESFDPTIVAWFRRNAPDILRGQLSQPPKEYGTALSKPAAAIVGNVLTNVIARPQFIAYKIGPKPLSVRLCEAMGRRARRLDEPAPGRTSATTTSSSSSTTVPARGSARTSERRASLHTVKNSQQPSRQMPARLLAVDCCACASAADADPDAEMEERTQTRGT